MDYYYGDALRWSYGFDNPNKAAALFAGGLALAWMLWMLAGRPRSPWLRGLALVLSAGVVLATAFLLFKTYSRGGAVAGGVAIAYLIARGAGSGAGGRLVRLGRDVAMLAAVGGVFWWTGLADRSLEPLAESGDASVENRMVMWRSALQMAADQPEGFGPGRSGEVYMNWYQPVEMRAGYRTMVNSYLTALVEWGWPVFAGLALVAGFFWGWANPGRAGTAGGDVSAGLRAVILAFAVAGIFSTTMEESGLWILPAACAGLLIAWTGVERRAIRAAAPATACAALFCLVLAGLGWWWRSQDAEGRNFRPSAKGEWSVEIGPARAAAAGWAIVSDDAVLGPVPGKLIRPLALRLGSRLDVGGAPKGDRLIVAGDGVLGKPILLANRLVLLAPAKLPIEEAEQILASAPRVLVFVPEIDEDGRAASWIDAAANRKNVEVVTVEGVGRRLDWAWEQVVERLRREVANKAGPGGIAETTKKPLATHPWRGNDS